MNKTAVTLIISLMTGITLNLQAQDTDLPQENTVSTHQQTDDSFHRHHLSLGIQWRNFLANDFGNWGAGFNYKLDDGTAFNLNTAGLSAIAGLSITRHTAITAGLEITLYSGKATGNFTESYQTSDPAGDQLTYTYRLTNYREQQRLIQLTVPLMLKLTANPFTDVSTKYFVAFGFKLGIPIAGWTKIKPGQLTTTALFHEENILYKDIPEQGLVTDYPVPSIQTPIKFKIGTALAFETGLIFMSNEKINAGVSIYCDLGLNSLLKSDNRYMVEYRKLTPDNWQFNSILKSNRTSSVEMFNLGLKLFVTINRK